MNKQKKIKFQAMTLLELMIGLVLIGILLTTLFSCYKEILKKKATVLHLEMTIQEQEIFNQRLHLLFASLRPIQTTTQLYLYPHPDAVVPALVFHFENKLDRNKAFLGELQAMLFLDEKKCLFLSTWGHDESIRSECLLEKIDTICYRFFDQNKKMWVENWPPIQQEHPVMVQVMITQEHNQISFPYFLADPSEMINYSNQAI